MRISIVVKGPFAKCCRIRSKAVGLYKAKSKGQKMSLVVCGGTYRRELFHEAEGSIDGLISHRLQQQGIIGEKGGGR